MRDQMDSTNPMRLLSAFYIALWGQLDALSDERRWVRTVGSRAQGELEQRADDVLKELSVTSQVTLSISLKQLEADKARAQEFLYEWHGSQPEARERLRARLEELRGYFEQQGLAFGAAAAAS